MTLLPATLLELARIGSALRVDARKVSHSYLNQIAAAAAESGARLTIVNADSLSPDAALTLARIGGTAIQFDLAN